MYDIKIGDTSVFDEAEKKEEKISDEYWEKNEDADGFDEPQLIDEPVLDKFVEELIQENTDV